ncbi:MAG: cell division protein FtsQ/DivIB [Oceanipulchritudo sp.]
MAGRKESPGFSWRKIQQKNRKGQSSRSARKRRLLILFRSSLVILLLVAIVAGILALRYFGQVSRQPPVPMEESASLDLTFRSDGVLTDAWFRQRFSETLDGDIRQVDVGRLKEQLEQEGQVLSASVTLTLPSDLEVVLEERVPMLRVRLRGAGGTPEVLLVARDGTIYQGAQYPPETLKSLPGVAGLRIRRSGGRYVRLQGLEVVADLLGRAREQLPALFRHWRVIDLSDWNPELDYRPSLVRVRSSHIEEIVFSTDGINEQLERLGGILYHVQRYQLGQPKSIDLSFGDEAVIRYN